MKEFAKEHPILTFLIADRLIVSVVNIVNRITQTDYDKSVKYLQDHGYSVYRKEEPEPEVEEENTETVEEATEEKED